MGFFSAASDRGEIMRFITFRISAILPRSTSALVLMALVFSVLGGCSAPPPSVGPLRTIDGSEISVLEGKPGHLRIVFFLDPVCPIANAYVPEIRRIIDSQQSEDLDVVVVHPDRALRDEEAIEHAKAYALPQPILIDRRHAVVRAIGATITPEAALIRFGEKPGSFEVLYLGRIDDLHRDFGVRRAQPTRRDLLEAIREVRRGEPISVPRTQAIGCFIHPGG